MSSSEEDVHDAALAAMGGTSDDEDAPDHDAALDALAAAGDRPYNLSHLNYSSEVWCMVYGVWFRV